MVDSAPSLPGDTPWTLIEAAQVGDASARAAFVRDYLAVVRGWLALRWRCGVASRDVDDAVQDVFLDCLHPGGALARVARGKTASFRAYLRGVARVVALRHERRRGQAMLDDLPDGESLAREAELDRSFDRAWALQLLSRAQTRHARLAKARGQAAERRLKLLRLRFEEGLAIREIAQRWEADAGTLHREYAKARAEFEEALRAEVRLQVGDAQTSVDRECRELLGLIASAREHGESNR